MKLKNLLIFDFDGVLCNSFDSIINDTNITLRKLHLSEELTKKELEELHTMSFSELIKILNVPVEKQKIFIQEILDSFDVNNSKPYEGIIEMVSSFHDCDVCINTTNSETNVRKFLKANGMAQKFEVILDSKFLPDKCKKIEWAVNHFCVDKTHTYMIGDSNSDIIAAKNAGVNSIAAAWGFQNKESLIKENPDIIVMNPRELLSIINGL
jgi:phosphoglycolate phosphatase